MFRHEIISVFSPTWWISIILTTIFILITIKWSQRLTENMQRKIAKWIGAILLFLAIFIHVYQIIRGEWVVQASLPLNLCSLSGLLSGLVLLFPNQAVFEFLLFWGIPGAFHSFITPEFTLGSNGWYFYDYYLSHCGIILSAVYLRVIFNYKPRKLSWLRVFGWSQLMMIIVYFIDKYTDSNYMYMVSKPLQKNPFIIGEWPWYIFMLDIFALIHFYVVYLIFRKRNIE